MLMDDLALHLVSVDLGQTAVLGIRDDAKIVPRLVHRDVVPVHIHQTVAQLGVEPQRINIEGVLRRFDLLGFQRNRVISHRACPSIAAASPPRARATITARRRLAWASRSSFERRIIKLVGLLPSSISTATGSMATMLVKAHRTKSCV